MVQLLGTVLVTTSSMPATVQADGVCEVKVTGNFDVAVAVIG